MHRPILILNGFLIAILAVLWGIDAQLEKRAREKRLAESIFLPPAGASAPPIASVARLELLLPGSETRWSYVHRQDGWHIPGYRDAFALGQEIQGILAAFLESRGTGVGRLPADQAHFGLDASRAMEVSFFDASDKLLVRAWGGLVAPGQRSSECFMAAQGSDLVLHVASNPWAFVSWAPGGRFPPLIDGKVIPVALGRGGVARLTLGGREPPRISELVRREIPQDPQQRFGPDRGPRYEWYGKLPEGEKRLNDSAAWSYASGIQGTTFEDLIGPLKGREGLFEPAALTITLEYDGGAKDTLTIGAEDRGFRPLLNSTTAQAFSIAAGKAKSLFPDVTALLEKPAEPPPK